LVQSTLLHDTETSPYNSWIHLRTSIKYGSIYKILNSNVEVGLYANITVDKTIHNIIKEKIGYTLCFG
ncbi:hypothetical protein ACJX0J_039086, partial [Zea mays]